MNLPVSASLPPPDAVPVRARLLVGGLLAAALAALLVWSWDRAEPAVVAAPSALERSLASLAAVAPTADAVMRAAAAAEALTALADDLSALDPIERVVRVQELAGRHGLALRLEAAPEGAGRSRAPVADDDGSAGRWSVLVPRGAGEPSGDLVVLALGPLPAARVDRPAPSPTHEDAADAGSRGGALVLAVALAGMLVVWRLKRAATPPGGMTARPAGDASVAQPAGGASSARPPSAPGFDRSAPSTGAGEVFERTALPPAADGEPPQAASPAGLPVLTGPTALADADLRVVAFDPFDPFNPMGVQAGPLDDMGPTPSAQVPPAQVTASTSAPPGAETAAGRAGAGAARLADDTLDPARPDDREDHSAAWPHTLAQIAGWATRIERAPPAQVAEPAGPAPAVEAAAPEPPDADERPAPPTDLAAWQVLALVDLAPPGDAGASAVACAPLDVADLLRHEVVAWSRRGRSSRHGEAAPALAPPIVPVLDLDPRAVVAAQGDPRVLPIAFRALLQQAVSRAHRAVVASASADDVDVVVRVDDDGGAAWRDTDSGFGLDRALVAAARHPDRLGLPLAIAHRAARWHGGAVTIEDSPLGGRRVTLRWPVAGPAASPAGVGAGRAPG